MELLVEFRIYESRRFQRDRENYRARLLVSNKSLVNSLRGKKRVKR